MGSVALEDLVDGWSERVVEPAVAPRVLGVRIREYVRGRVRPPANWGYVDPSVTGPVGAGEVELNGGPVARIRRDTSRAIPTVDRGRHIRDGQVPVPVG